MRWFAGAPKIINASHYYRVDVPFRAMEKLYDDFAALLAVEGESSLEAQAEAFCRSDVNLVYQPIGDALIDQVQTLKRNMKSRRPVFVIDTDDNLFAVAAYNHTYKDLGVRRPDGTKLRIGDEIGIQAKDGRSKVLWKDRKDGFSVVENWYRLETYRALLNEADLITCSTPAVAASVKREVGEHAPTFVSPNSVIPEDYEQVELMPHDDVRILWQGSPTHFVDVQAITPSIIKLAAKYPQTKWIFWGANYVPLERGIPASQYRHIPWASYDAFKVRLPALGHDINLAPLTQNPFEECRSAIKWYESSVIRHPAATLAQRTGDFALEMEDGVTGLLFDDEKEFEEKLEALILDKTMARRLASAGKEWVMEHRRADKVVPPLYTKCRELMETLSPSEPQYVEV